MRECNCQLTGIKRDLRDCGCADVFGALVSLNVVGEPVETPGSYCTASLNARTHACRQDNKDNRY